METTRGTLLQRVCRFWARRVPLPFDIAMTVCAALQHHSRRCTTQRIGTCPMLCLPRNLQEEVFRLLPTQDR